jgi:CBS domain-containing protein
MANRPSGDDVTGDEDTGERPEPPTSVRGAPVTFFAADEVVVVPAAADLAEVAKRLVANEVGMLVVGTVESVAGVVSERDVVRAVATATGPLTVTAGDIASTNLVWCDATATVDEVAELMMSKYLRHVLVEEDGRLVGVVSARDLLGAYATADG